MVLKKQDFFSAFATSRPRQMVDIQYGIKIMGGREVSRPYRVWFFAEGERFLSFWRSTGIAKRLFFMFFVSVPPVFIH